MASFWRAAAPEERRPRGQVVALPEGVVIYVCTGHKYVETGESHSPGCQKEEFPRSIHIIRSGPAQEAFDALGPFMDALFESFI
ncbi:MAG: hypothetical protein P8Y39_08950 [Nitrospirota bacterium]|jgi:hypothetical protein